jgi:hypothetical protein
MANERQSNRREVYQITVRGIIQDDWSDWFDGLTIMPQASCETLLSGPIVDQAALFGVLNRIHDLGLPLISVTRTESRDAKMQAADEADEKEI